MSFYKYHAIVTTVTLIITLSLPSTDKMYRTFLIHVLFICILTVAALSTRAAENHADKIVAQIMETRDAIIANAGANSADEFVFLSFWDFDGTLLQGDCSEGLTIADKPIYKGLAQLTIEAGHSSIYPTTADIHRFWRDYPRIRSWN